MQKLLNDLNIKQHFTTIQHPQTNGQAKTPNMVILKGLKMGLMQRAIVLMKYTMYCSLLNHTPLNNQRDNIHAHI
jgi:hypothetical protein